MKIVEINSVCRGSTGNIMLNIAKKARENGDEVYTFSSTKKECPPEGHGYFGTFAENILHRIFSVFLGISGKGSVIGTYQLLRKIKEIDPDILHLHNLHGWYINLPMLFNFIKKHHIKTVWTLHDCWAFTAQCSHFTIEKCSKWKTGCYSCPRYRLYPYTFVDRTRRMWKLKRAWFNGVEDLTIVTPSQWLANLVKQSFLKDYTVKVVNNGIDLSVFKPTISEFREKNGLTNKKIILGVSFVWTNRKGLDVFIELSRRLGNDYKIVLVGINDNIDKQLPENIISVHRTYNQRELAEIYTAADVFVNPTREENFPTVNMEAIACGTPVITFDTGGSKEMLTDECSIVVPCDDFEALLSAITTCCESVNLEKDACIAVAQKYDHNVLFGAYCRLYADLEAKSKCTT